MAANNWNDKSKLKMIIRKEIGCNIFIAVCFFVCMYISFYLFSEYQSEEKINQARLLLQDDYEAVTDMYENKQYTVEQADKVAHPFCVLGLDGSVIYDSEDNKTANNVADKIDKNSDINIDGNDNNRKHKYNMLKELQVDHAYSSDNPGESRITFPIMKEDAVNAFVIFGINSSEIEKPVSIKTGICLLPLIIWGICVMAIICFRTVYKKYKIYKPLTILDEEAERILAGNYSEKRVIEAGRVDEVVSKLSYSFDMMRDELYDKSVREEALKKSQKELLSCMSHDLRTPITTIQAHVEALRDGIYQTEEKQKNAIGIILNKAKALNIMIEKLLEHSNTELHQLSILKKECYQKPFFDNLNDELEMYCRNLGCVFRYDNNCKDMLLNIDEGRITEVVYNLVENACKYAGNDGTVSHPEVRLSLECLEAERKLQVCVEDNGAGIDMEDIPYVFDRFYRAEKSRSMRIPGTGLGLSICKYIIEEHNGTIEIESHKNEGTVVRFTLPY